MVKRTLNLQKEWLVSTYNITGQVFSVKLQVGNDLYMYVLVYTNFPYSQGQLQHINQFLVTRL